MKYSLKNCILICKKLLSSLSISDNYLDDLVTIEIFKRYFTSCKMIFLKNIKNIN